MRLVRFVCGCNIFSEQRIPHLAVGSPECVKHINVSWEIFIAYYDVNIARIKRAFSSLSMINKVGAVF